MYEYATPNCSVKSQSKVVCVQQGYWQAACYTAGPLSLPYATLVNQALVNILVSLLSTKGMFDQTFLVPALSKQGGIVYCIVEANS